MISNAIKLIILTVIIGIIGCDELKAADGESELMGVCIIYRHGARNIVAPIKTDKNNSDESHWSDGGFGGLTNQGKWQQYNLGKYLRKRYDLYLNNSKNLKDQIYVQSTDVDRCLMSAAANLAGMFPPADNQIWNSELMWQPIPIHTIPEDSDYVLASRKPCPLYNCLLEKMLKSSEYTNLIAHLKPLFKYLELNTGAPVRDMITCAMIYDTLDIMRMTNRTLPEWAVDLLEPDSDLQFCMDYLLCKVKTNTPEMTKVTTGFLLKEILEHLSQRMYSKVTKFMRIYSAHDITIASILNGLGFSNCVRPPYASCLMFELHKLKKTYYIKMYYKSSPESNALTALYIPNCGIQCSLKRFQKIYSNILPKKSFEDECKPKSC